MKDEAALEAEIQSKGLNAPRLTPAMIDAVIVGEQYLQPAGTTLTICVLTLRNGFTVTGESAAASPANFDEVIGQKIARENARAKIWALEGYALRERIGPTGIERTAMRAHEANRGYCLALGDTSQVPWEEAPDWQRQSAIKGVQFIIDNPDASPAESHVSWLKEKRRDGWKYGPVKDAEAKTHPCFVPYDELPIEQRAKDYIFGAVVRASIR